MYFEEFAYLCAKTNINKTMNQYSVNTSADLVVYGKIFTSEGNQIVEAFAVKDGKYIYVGDKAGVEAYIEAGKTEVLDYTGKGLVMPSCGNGHAHYSVGVALPIVGTVAIGQTPEELLTREQAIASLTINIAKQMLIEDERGSISEGKYADFLLVNKNVLSCPVDQIHEAKPAATYFEGKKVYAM